MPDYRDREPYTDQPPLTVRRVLRSVPVTVLLGIGCMWIAIAAVALALAVASGKVAW